MSAKTNKPESGKDDAAEIAKRFESLVESSSQAEVARKTDTPTTSISRYVAGGKIPASFCAKLVRKLGVNPSWLLVGEGTPKLTDVAGSTASLAGNMLELVNAMNAVAGMRLGELVGKDHLKVLRQLNDAITRYDELKSQLNDHSGDVMKELLSKLSHALNQNQARLAERYLEACKQMARLRDDHASSIELARLEGDYSRQHGNAVQALECYKRVLVARLGASNEIGEEYCASVKDYVMALARICRIDEALRITESALALIRDKPKLERWNAYLNIAAASFDVELGRLHEAASRSSQYLPLVHDEERESALFQHAQSQLYAGVWSLRRGPVFEANALAISTPFLRFARLCDNEEILRDAFRRFVGDRAGRVSPRAGVARATQYFLDALDGKDVVKEYLAFSSEQADFFRGGSDEGDVVMKVEAINCATLLRYAGRTSHAIKEVRKAAELLDTSAEGEVLPLLYRAYHQTNVLTLARATKKLDGELDDELVARACDFFAFHIDKGYQCFLEIEIVREHLQLPAL